MSEPVIVVHGGAGNIPDCRDQPKFDGILAAVRAAYVKYGETSSITDACQTAVESMEDDEAFNAGRGSVLNLKGEIEMEALIMEGDSMKAGKCWCISVGFRRSETDTHFFPYPVRRQRYRCEEHCASHRVGQKSDGKHTPRVSDGFECRRFCRKNGIRES